LKSVRDDLTKRWAIGSALAVSALLLVFLPRLTHLSGYLIIDEADRWRWAEEFFRALTTGDLHATLVGDGYPGIVPAWVETLWLLGEAVRRSIVEGRWFSQESIYMLFHVWSRTEHLALQRLPIALFNGTLALLIALYAGRLYGRRVGVVTLILVALNPFYLADSRVNRAEAVITGLLTLCVLALVDHRRTRRLRPLVLSGILGGLAFLTKIQGLVILPVVGVTLLLANLTSRPPLHAGERGGRGVRLIMSAALWLLAAAVTWSILWPAMWVRPLDVLSLVYEYATRKAGAEGVNVFFAGRHFLDTDPGGLFYLVVILFRLTPLTLVGLVLAVAGCVRRWRSDAGYPARVLDGHTWPLVVYVVLYTLAMSLGSHKQDRYLMPIFLVLDILAALGWVALGNWLAGKWPRLRTNALWSGIGAAALLAVQLATALPHHPYYFPYFNPLVGGGATGARMLRVGWGEGMDRVAQYLNAKPDAARLTVAARWYSYMVDFAGKAIAFDQQGRWTRADYMVLYIQQTQRMLDPSPGVIRYFQRLQPEYTVTLAGIEYAQIYRSPFTRAAQPSVSRIPDQAALFGYRWDATAPAEVRVVWENLGAPDVPLTFVAALSDISENPSWQSCVVAPGFEAEAITAGGVVESVCRLTAKTDHAPFARVYDVRFGLKDASGKVSEFTFPEAWQSLVYEPGAGWRLADWSESLDFVARRDIPSEAVTVDRYHAGQIRLAAYTLSNTALHAGEPLTVTLYWQAVQPITKDYVVFNHLFGLDGVEVGRADGAPPIATSRWLPGQVIRTVHVIPTAPDLAVPAAATLQVGLYDQGDRALPITDRAGQPLSVGMTRVKFVPAVWPTEAPPVYAGVRFGEALLLEGHSELPLAIRPGEEQEVAIRLWWQALSPVASDYAVFVHLVNEAGDIVAQADGAPLAGRYPTSMWAQGERIIDPKTLILPERLPEGVYRLMIGVYHPLDNTRLPVADSNSDSWVADVLPVVVGATPSY
jgi:hypothetical protein